MTATVTFGGHTTYIPVVEVTGVADILALGREPSYVHSTTIRNKYPSNAARNPTPAANANVIKFRDTMYAFRECTSDVKLCN
jgi:hypothetical protein